MMNVYKNDITVILMYTIIKENKLHKLHIKLLLLMFLAVTVTKKDLSFVALKIA